MVSISFAESLLRGNLWFLMGIDRIKNEIERLKNLSIRVVRRAATRAAPTEARRGMILVRYWGMTLMWKTATISVQQFRE